MSVYLVSVCEITNMNDNLKSYAQKSAELITKYGGAYLIRGPSIEVLEGIQLNNKSLIIAEFQMLSQSRHSWAGTNTGR